MGVLLEYMEILSNILLKIVTFYYCVRIDKFSNILNIFSISMFQT